MSEETSGSFVDVDVGWGIVLVDVVEIVVLETVMIRVLRFPYVFTRFCIRSPLRSGSPPVAAGISISGK